MKELKNTFKWGKNYCGGTYSPGFSLHSFNLYSFNSRVARNDFKSIRLICKI